MRRCCLLLGCRCRRAAKPTGRVADDDEHDDHGRNRVPDAPILEIHWPVLPLLPVSILAEMPLACHRSVRAAARLACWNLWLGTGLLPEDPERWDTSLGSRPGHAAPADQRALQTIWTLPIYHR